MGILKITALVVASLTVMYGFHRLCDWAEAKGWIFYRKTRASGNALGASALRLQALFESDKARPVLQAREQKPAKDLVAGGRDR